MRSRILVVGRDVAVRARLARALRAAGYGIELADNATDARRIARRGIALTIVSREAAGPAGGTLVDEMQGAVGKTLIVTPVPAGQANGADVLDVADEAGLLARVAEVLQPAPEAAPDPAMLRFATFSLDLAGHSLTDAAGAELALTRSEFSLLRAFVLRPGRVLSRDYLLQALAGREAEAFDRSIDMLVVRLRRKIEPDPKRPSLILTVPGTGYKFAARVSEARDVLPPEPEPEPEPEPVPPSPETAPAIAERRQVTALAAELLDPLPDDPEERRRVIAAYRRYAAAVIARHGGTFAQCHLRDVLAWFGYPVAEEYAAAHAIRAGLALAEHLPEGDAALPSGLALRVGIASGLVLADPAGEMMGETPGLATRLHDLAAPDRVVVAERTRRLAGRLFAYDALEPRLLPGLPHPVRAWQVLGPTALTSRSEALYADALTRLIGREDELDLLRRAWRRAADGEGRLVLLTGEPGIGKSRLLAALENELAAEPHASLRYFCSPLHRDSPLHPVVARWEQEAGFTRGDSPEDRWRKLEAILAPAAMPPADVALIAALLAVPPGPRDPTPELSPQQRKERTFDALRRRLISLTRGRPLLMLFEDAHWADPSSLDLLDMLVEQLTDLPILLIISYRPDFTPPWTGRAGTTLIALSRFDRRQSADLVAEVTAQRALPAALRDHIVAHADGVPLFIEELTRTVLEAPTDPAAALPFAVPDSLQGTLMTRLDRLPAAKSVAQIGAGIGREFAHGLLVAAAELPDAQLVQGLEELVAGGFVTRRGAPPDAVYTFRHALVQDAAYDMLPRDKRQDLHARLARVLEERFPDIATQHPEVLGRHCTFGGLKEQAIAYWAQAGGKCAGSSAMAEAAVMFRRGLELLRDLPATGETRIRELQLQGALAAALYASKGPGVPETGRAYARARELCEELGDRPALIPVLSGQWSHYSATAHYREARRIAEDLLHLAQESNDRASLLLGSRAMGTSLFLLGEVAASRAHFERVLTLYDPALHRCIAAVATVDPRAAALSYLSWNNLILGYPDQAVAWSVQALAWSRTLSHPHTLGYALTWGAIFHLLRRAEAAAGLLEELADVGKRRQFPHFVAVANIMRGYLLTQGGAAGEGLALAQQGCSDMVTMGVVWNQPYFLALLAQCHDRAGDRQGAVAALTRAVQTAERTGERWFAPELHRLQGLWLMEDDQGVGTLAEQQLQRALAMARTQQARMWELRAAVSLGRLRCMQGKPGEARKMLAPVRSRFTEGLDIPDMTDAGMLLGSA